MNDYDVVVVGGRVAGASTALLLGRAGARVALVDRSRAGTDTVSTHALMRAGVLQLSRWGLLGRVVAAGTPAIRSTSFHYADGRTERVAIRPTAGVDALYAPRRYLFDRLVLDAAAQAGVDIFTETAVTALRYDETGRVRGVCTVNRSGRTLELPASMTVGADGIRSTVAALIPAPVLRQGRYRSAVLYRYVAGVAADGYQWAYGIGGAAAGLIPTNDGQTCVFVSTTPERMRALRRYGVEHAFSELLIRAAPTLLDPVVTATPAGPIRGWGGVPGYLRHCWGAGWALVGDAGYFKDPITTHGMTDAMRDAELFAEAMLDATGGLPEAVALARYQAIRGRLSSQLFAATEDIAAYDWTIDRVQTLLRRVSSAMGDEVKHLQAQPNRALTGLSRRAWSCS